MTWSSRVAALSMAGVAMATIAWACADGGNNVSMFEAAGSPAILSPTADTRANYLLLVADRDGTIVADPKTMAKGIVPTGLAYQQMRDRLSPPGRAEQSYEDYEKSFEPYGLSGRSYDYKSQLGLCHTNRDGVRQFVDAVSRDTAVTATEKTVLIAAREALGKACDKAAEAGDVRPRVASPTGAAYANYLDGARLFYAEQFGAAGPRFNAAVAAADPGSWLAEAGAYMRFRNALAAAMLANFDEWGGIKEPAQRNQSLVREAADMRAAYLKAYPSGRYTASARDLGRRIAWLAGDEAAQARAYSDLFARSQTRGGVPNLDAMDELDIKYLPTSLSAGVTDPILLAVADLMRLRATGEYDKERTHDGALLTRSELDGQRAIFAKAPNLYGFLLAAEAFYNRKAPREVLALIPDAAHQPRFSYVQFNRQMLRGFALEAVKDRNARAFWLSLLPGATQPYQREAVELALYEHDRDAGALGRMFETGSMVLNPLIRQHAIEEDAGPALLRQQAKLGITQQQRDVALYLLLANELNLGLYRDYLTDQQLLGGRKLAKGSGYAWSASDYDPTYSDTLSPPPLYQVQNSLAIGAGCPNLGSTVTALAADPAAVRPRLCFAEFIRGNGFDGWNTRYDDKTSAFVTRPRNGFSGQPVTRDQIYRSVIASPAASDDDKAFALNRAIRCYQPSGMNACGPGEVPQATRKAWFLRLKSQYGTTTWAKELKYYW